jgi:hypothetical protein
MAVYGPVRHQKNIIWTKVSDVINSKKLIKQNIDDYI